MDVLGALTIMVVFVLPFIVMTIMALRAPQGCETDEFGFRRCNGCDGQNCPSSREATTP